MRIALVIVSFAAIAVGLVTLRRHEAAARRHTQDLRMQQRELQRKLTRQDRTLVELKAPVEVHRRSQEMGLEVVDSEQAEYGLAPGDRAHRRQNK